MKGFFDGLIDNDEKVASCKTHTQFKTIVLKPYPFHGNRKYKLLSDVFSL